MSQKKQLSNLLFSTLGVLLVLALIVSINVITARFKKRIDLTAGKNYTLSQGTRNILAKIDTPVEIRYYYSSGDSEMPVPLKNYATRVEDLLGEFAQANKNIEVKKLNPTPDSDAEESASLDGITGEAISMTDKIYLGIAVSSLDQKSTIPFLSPGRESLLEYDLTRAISQVVNPQKNVVGVMSSFPVMPKFDPIAMQQGQRPQPWVFINELKRDYTVREIALDAAEIPKDIKVLIVLHPKGISEIAQWAIDQFVLRGGKLIAFVDPLSFVDMQSMGQQQMMQGAPTSSDLPALFKAWGITYDSSKVLADLTYGMRSPRGEANPPVLDLNKEALNDKDISTGEISNLLIPYSGAFRVKAPEGIQETVLLQSSKNSQLVDAFIARSGQDVTKDFVSSSENHLIGVRLQGKFKTAFPKGKPNTDGTPTPADQKPKWVEGELQDATEESIITLFSDADFIYDQVAGQLQNLMGRRVFIPENGNLSLLFNTIDFVSGDKNLISIRSRASQSRPFTLVREMQAQAENQFQARIRELESKLTDTQQKLNQLQQAKAGEGQQQFILSPEQQQEIKRFREQEAAARKDLKQLRKDLRKNIDTLETKLKWANIFLLPFAVALIGILFALLNHRKRSAK